MPSLLFPLSFDRQYAGPLDDYYVFNTTDNRTAFTSNGKRYEGLISYDAEEKKVYVLKNNSGTWDWVELAQGTGNYQTASANLTSLSGLTWVSGSPFVIMTAANTFALDTTVYATASALSSLTTTVAGKQDSLNGTGFVKASGGSISYDNNTYLTTSTASSTYLTITNAGNTYLPIAATNTSSGSNITLDFSQSDTVFGTSSAITGTIIINTTGAKLGVTHIVIHNAASLTITGSVTKLTGSGNYKANVVNYIYFTFVGSTVIYSINQAA